MSTITDTTTSAAEEARTWIAEHWSGSDTAEWRSAVVHAGWAVPTWEKGNFGRGLSRKDAAIVAQQFQAVDAPGAALDLNAFRSKPWLHLLGNPLRAFGSEAIRAELLPKILSGEIAIGCLLYSEPGAGSDLAGLQTRAELDGDEYVVNGQKIWTTGGHEAQFALLLARTDWDVVKHAGLSFFVLDMNTAGIEVRPIKQITGDTEFNEVFLTDVRVPAARMVGAPGEGWKVVQTALAAERAGMGESVQTETTRGSIAGEAAELVAAAKLAGRESDPITRQEIARLLAWKLSNKWTGERALFEARRGSFALANVGKLAMSRIMHGTGDLEYRLQGRASFVYDYENPLDYPVDRDLMFAFINSIGGGSDQIQRNIISERVLGLPKGYEPDKGAAFRDIRKDDTSRKDR